MQKYFIHEYGNGNIPIALLCVSNDAHPVPIAIVWAEHEDAWNGAV